VSDVTVFGFPHSTFVQIARLVVTHKEVPYIFHDLDPTWAGLSCPSASEGAPGASEGAPGVLLEIDHVLALMGVAHWSTPFDPGSEAKPRATTYDRRADRRSEAKGTYD
jgi:hypothetical protein